MTSLGFSLKAAKWALRSGSASLRRGWSWEMSKGCRRFSTESEENDVPTSGISRPISEILKELNKKVPDSVIRTRVEDGFSIKYIPWHIVNRIMNMHAPEWSGEVRNVTYSPDGNTVTVVYRVTLYGTDAEIFRESTGTTSVDDKGYGDAVQKAEAMAFRRACARFGLGLHLYHEDAL
ncbi:unnamed protein product [Cochlearia groenlandica]